MPTPPRGSWWPWASTTSATTTALHRRHGACPRSGAASPTAASASNAPPERWARGGPGKALFFVVGFVAVMSGIGQLTTGRRTVLLAAAPAVIAAVVAYPFGPSALPPVAVAGEARRSAAGGGAGTGAAGGAGGRR